LKYSAKVIYEYMLTAANLQNSCTSVFFFTYSSKALTQVCHILKFTQYPQIKMTQEAEDPEWF